MACYRLVAAVVLGSLLLLGCAKRELSKLPSDQDSTTAPPTTEGAATMPAASQPSQSSLVIDGKLYLFPPARLRVTKSNGHVLTRLYSADPKAALADDYKGNGYDLVMKLDDISEPSDVYSSVWQHKAQSNDFVESPYGIFLEGIRYQLQPADVTARFLGDTMWLRIDLSGKFLQFDQSETRQPGKPVFVEGHLLAPVEYRD